MLRRVAVGVGILALGGGATVAAVRYVSRRLPAELGAPVREIAQGLEAAASPSEAAKVRAACAAPKQLCDCITLAASSALDTDLKVEALVLLDKAEGRCEGGLFGLRAEALARVSRFDEARHAADLASRALPRQHHAELALGLAAFANLELKEAEPHAKAAVDAGRGAEAHRLLSRIALSRGNYEVARDEAKRVLAERPNDSAMAFTAAMCSAYLKQFDEARRGFEDLLRRNPDHVEARVYLLLTTLASGARDEATQQLKELEQRSPNEPRLADLRSAVALAGNQGHL